MYIVIRTINRKTHSAHLAGQDATGIRSNHIGDIICCLPDTHKFSGNERTHFAVIKVVLPPPFDEENIIEQLLATTEETVAYDEETQEPMKGTLRPRKIKFSRSEFNSHFNASDQAKMDRAFDRADHVAQEDIPEFNWGQFKQLFKDKDLNAVIEVK